MNYFVLDKIEKDPDSNCYWGFLNGEKAEVFPLLFDYTEEELVKEGWAKCDAPNMSATFLVAESEAIFQ